MLWRFWRSPSLRTLVHPCIKTQKRFRMSEEVFDTKVVKIDPKNFVDAELSEAVSLIQKGDLVAFPTETVYGLGANALSSEATAKIFKAKKRPQDNPLIVHVSSMEMLHPLVLELPERILPMLRHFWPGPLTVLFKRSSKVPAPVASNLPTVAVRMPSHPIAQRLIALAGVPIAAPSANLSGRPSPTTAEHVYKDLRGRIPLIIDGGPTDFGVESTVIDIYSDPPIIFRPGGVTLEQLRQFLPNIQVLAHAYRYKKSSNLELEERPPTPGLKYRHYSPDAKVLLLEGSPKRMETELVSLVRSLLKENKKVGIIHTHSGIQLPANITTSPLCSVLSLGDENSPKVVAKGLYHALRSLDEKSVDVIVMEGIEETAEGLAVMNRIRKAASEIINVNEETVVV